MTTEKRCKLGYTEQQLLEFLAYYENELANSQRTQTTMEENIKDIQRRLAYVRGNDNDNT